MPAPLDGIRVVELAGLAPGSSVYHPLSPKRDPPKRAPHTDIHLHRSLHRTITCRLWSLRTANRPTKSQERRPVDAQENVRYH